MDTGKKEAVVLYGRPACPGVPPARAILRRADTEFVYVDISRDVAGRQHVREINNGYESVPTIVFPDGSTLTEPSQAALKRRLEELGFRVRRPNLWQALTENPIVLLLAVMFLVLGLASNQWWLAGVGLAVMAASAIYARLS